jgi:hypothetical protein
VAGFEHGWKKTLAVAVLLVGAGTASLAQSARTQWIEGGAEQGKSTGSLSGKLTDLHSKPLGGVPVIARNQATGAEAHTITTRNGVYRFSGLEPGEYALEAESPQRGLGHLGDIMVNAGHEARVQAAMKLERPPSEAILAELRQRNGPDLELDALPVSEAALAAEPLRLLPVRGQRLADLLGYGPRTETPEMDPRLAFEPLWTLAPAREGLEGSALPAFAASSPVHSGANGSQVTETRPGASAGTADNGAASDNASEAAVQGAQPGAQSEQVSLTPVQAAAAESSPATEASTTAMSAADLQALPVSGRHWQDFVLDNTPTSTTPAGGQGQISLRGADQSAEVVVDGVDQKLAFGTTSGSGQGSSGRGALGQDGTGPAGMARVGIGGHGLALTEAAIRVVQTVAGNVEAAVGKAAGGRLNVETQRGSNELHGQGFFFDRGNLLSAQNPFTQWVQNTGTATNPVFTSEPYTPPDRETTWGIGVGSRIRRNKLFWFTALDNNQRNDPGLAMVRYPDVFFAQPTNDQMQVLSARLGLSNADPVGEGLAQYNGMLEKLVGLLGPAPRTATQWTGFARLDWEATERHHITLEGIGARWNAPGGGLTRASETYGNHSFGSSKASQERLLGRWEAFLTPNLLSVTQASAGRAIQKAQPEAPSAFEQSFLGGNAWGQLPQIVVDGRYGFTIGNPSRFGQGSYPDEHLYQGRESVDWVRGKLLVKAGFEVSHNTDATSLLRNQTGTYYYSNVENFVSDALVYGAFGPNGALNPYDQHNCDETGKVWRDTQGTLRGLGNLPCYAFYSQTMGPAGWKVSTSDWAGYATAQWEPAKPVVLSAGLRWEREQLPPPLAALSNPGPLLTQKLPNLGNNWGPRLSLAVGGGKKHWPVFRLGYGMYYGRTQNLVLETALTQTGSFNGDLNFFMRSTDDLPNYGGGAPPFPYVLQGEPGSVVKPGAVEFAPGFRNPEVHQAMAAVEERLPGHIEMTATAMVSLGRRLPISIDTNLNPAVNPGTITYAVKDATGDGPIKAAQITVPFYASWPSTTSPTGFTGRLNPNYQQITQIMSRANLTYEAEMVRLARYGRRGLTVRAYYVYAHAMDWNPNESAIVAGNNVLDPADFSQEYGVSNLDVRHSAGMTVVYMAPWKLRGTAGKLGNNWMLSGVWQARSGRPYTMRVTGSLPKCFVSTGITPCTTSYQGLNATIGAAIVGLGPGMNGSGGDNRVYGVGRNTYRYPATWKADLRLGRRFDLGHMRQLDLLAESFNLFNHQNVTQLETTGYYIGSGSASSPFPTMNFLTGLKANTVAFGQPLNINATSFFRERQVQFGLRLRF